MMLTAGVGWANGFKTSLTFDSLKLHERPGIQSQAAAEVVTTDGFRWIRRDYYYCPKRKVP